MAEIGPQFWAPAVIGDFKEGEARAFFMMKVKEMEDELLQPSGKHDTSVDDEVWKQVYEVWHGMQLPVSVGTNFDV
jgi:hypothetical protein